MFFKPVKSEDWLSPDFVYNLESLEMQLELGSLFAKSNSNQLYAKLRHLINALLGIITDYLNSDKFSIEKFSIFKEVKNSFYRLQSCIDRLIPILEGTNNANKKLKISENQPSKTGKQEETFVEPLTHTSRKRKIGSDFSVTLNELSISIKFFIKISATANNVLENIFDAPNQLTTLSRELQAELDSGLKYSLNLLIEALQRSIQTFLEELKINDNELVKLQQELDAAQILLKENESKDCFTAKEKIIDITIKTQGRILDNLEDQETFIENNLAAEVDHIEILKDFTDGFTPYTWLGVIQVLKNLYNAYKIYCGEHITDEDNEFLTRIIEEIESAEIVKTLIIEAKKTLEKCYAEGAYNELIENLTTDKNKWKNFKENLENLATQEPAHKDITEKPIHQAFANTFCNFMIEATEEALYTLNEEHSLASSP